MSNTIENIFIKLSDINNDLNIYNASGRLKLKRMIKSNTNKSQSRNLTPISFRSVSPENSISTNIYKNKYTHIPFYIEQIKNEVDDYDYKNNFKENTEFLNTTTKSDDKNRKKLEFKEFNITKNKNYFNYNKDSSSKYYYKNYTYNDELKNKLETEVLSSNYKSKEGNNNPRRQMHVEKIDSIRKYKSYLAREEKSNDYKSKLYLNKVINDVKSVDIKLKEQNYYFKKKITNKILKTNINMRLNNKKLKYISKNAANIADLHSENSESHKTIEKPENKPSNLPKPVNLKEIMDEEIEEFKDSLKIFYKLGNKFNENSKEGYTKKVKEYAGKMMMRKMIRRMSNEMQDEFLANNVTNIGLMASEMANEMIEQMDLENDIVKNPKKSNQLGKKDDIGNYKFSMNLNITPKQNNDDNVSDQCITRRENKRFSFLIGEGDLLDEFNQYREMKNYTNFQRTQTFDSINSIDK